MLSQVSQEGFPALYRDYIAKDFHANERRPLATLQKLLRRGQYAAWAYQDEKGTMLAYACFMQVEGCGSLLLDHFAVVQGIRGQGIGGRFLTELKTNIPADGLVIEVEMPEKAADEEDREMRERRIAFYMRYGAEMSDYAWLAFSVHYNLLWLPIQKPLAQVEVGEQIQKFYGASVPFFLLKTRTKCYRLP